MRCEYCQKEYPVEDERVVGQEIRCPNCGIPSVCSDRRILIICPECHKELEGELWMLGTRAECTYCGKDILLSRPENPGDDYSNSYLPANYQLGNYLLKKCIGIGGMGEVYLAHHILLDRPCALKLLHPDHSGTIGDVSLDSLIHEARLACRIHSPYIVDVMDVQVDPVRKFGYIVMEYVEGRDIENIICEGPMSEEYVLKVARGVCHALTAAAAFDIVHRDIKPANILITPNDEVKLADLGIAKAGKDKTTASGGRITGTVHYAAPEQLLSSDNVDARADIYSLGATMYHMLSGRRPFEGGNIKAVISKVLKGDCLPLEKVAPQVSKECCKLVASMMDLQVDKRPENAEKLLALLDKMLKGPSGNKLLDKYIQLFTKSWKGYAIAGAAAVVLISGIVLGVMSDSSVKETKTAKALPPVSQISKTVKTEPQIAVAPKAPEAPKAPATPKAPEAPKAQAVPKDPAAPKAPEAPKAPAVPNAPEAPKAPAVPNAPEAPKAPAVPNAPEAPKAPATTQAPAAPKAPKADTRQVPSVNKAFEKVNFLHLLVMICWFLSGVKFFPYLEKKQRKGNKFVLQYGEYLNLAALVAAPIVFLIVEFNSRFAKKIKALSHKKESLPIIIDSQGNNAFETDAEENENVYYVRKMLAEALKLHASDIFIDPKTGDIAVLRFRVDGALRIIEEFSADFGSQIINVLKVAAGMNISERRRPQDGSFSLTGPCGDISLRVATVGAFSGEKIALRILGDDSGPKTLAAAGLTGKELTIMEQAPRLPSGMVLICGPTGSGKTTTLYAMLNSIDYSIKNVVSIEDPIEHVMPSISQMEVNESAGIGFSQLLRNALRQNPDIICLGEIRDEDTAQTAIHAAQTGHLIIATLHSNDNIGTIDRLANLNIPLRSIAGTLRMVISQRLVRKLCTCKKPHTPSEQEKAQFKNLGIECGKIFAPKGCSKCGNTGYSGRMALFEILLVDDELRGLLEDEHTNLSNIQKKLKATAEGNAMLRSGYDLVAKGITSLDEVLRVTMELKN